MTAGHQCFVGNKHILGILTQYVATRSIKLSVYIFRTIFRIAYTYDVPDMNSFSFFSRAYSEVSLLCTDAAEKRLPITNACGETICPQTTCLRLERCCSSAYTYAKLIKFTSAALFSDNLLIKNNIYECMQLFFGVHPVQRRRVRRATTKKILHKNSSNRTTFLPLSHTKIFGGTYYETSEFGRKAGATCDGQPDELPGHHC